MTEPTPIKAELRQRLRQRRALIPAQDQRHAAVTITALARQLPQWQTAKSIGLYHSTEQEISTVPLGELCLIEGKQCFLPIVCDKQPLEFARWRTGDTMQSNHYGISEPIPTAARIEVEELDILFMPLLGWDRRGNRLGMGGGYYDRTLAGVTGPLRVGLAFAVQELDNIPRQDWDISLDVVLTEKGAHECTQGN